MSDLLSNQYEVSPDVKTPDKGQCGAENIYSDKMCLKRSCKQMLINI